MSGENPLVTLSFPVYKGEEYIEASLRSALNQDYANIEFLIIDDKGSTAAMNIVNEVINKYKRDIRIIEHTKNLGQGFVRNTSIDNANGDYIFFIDSDDIITPDCISKMVKFIVSYEVVFVEASSISVNNKKQSTHSNHPTISVVKDRLVIDSIYIDNIAPSSFMWNKLYNLSFLRDNQIRCKHPYIEDFHFSFQLFCKAQSFVLLPDVTYHYVIHSDSTTRSKMAKGIPLKTLNIVLEIIAEEYKLISTLSNKITREKALLDTVGFGIMYLYHAYNSTFIDNEIRKEYAKIVLRGLKFNFVGYKSFSNYQKRKHIYYLLIQHLPVAIKINFVKFINFPHYKKRGI